MLIAADEYLCAEGASNRTMSLPTSKMTSVDDEDRTRETHLPAARRPPTFDPLELLSIADSPLKRLTTSWSYRNRHRMRIMGDLTGGQNPIGVFESSMSNASRMLYYMTEAKVLGVHLANTQILADLPLEISLEEATNCLLSDWFHFEDVLLTARHRGFRTRTVYTHSGIQQLEHHRMMDYALTMPHTIDPDVTVMKVMDLFLVTLKCADDVVRYELDETEEAVCMQFHMLMKLQQTYGASVDLRAHTNALLGDLMRYYDQMYGCSGAVRLGNLVACLEIVHDMNRAVAHASALHRLNMRKDGECCRNRQDFYRWLLRNWSVEEYSNVGRLRSTWPEEFRNGLPDAPLNSITDARTVDDSKPPRADSVNTHWKY